ncbi:DUF6799 domain-containing protein [Hymenobacter canadensis]|uniref:DUF6799 domain-containing protein n=1 Tax=Hymenobacter canadensis TaxID=2999067 RepID=A0ABY7LQE6_9BACT|nr:DUF6799 domain-containing protein [Hymenobacter canadensis]WBA42132.1 hypothetical protein O3303_00925 [Hymenobacter canadensis]
MLRHVLSLSLMMLLSTPAALLAQSTTATAAAPAKAQHFIVQDHEVVLRKDDKIIALTKNVMLPGSIKINYKSGIIEYPDGRKIALKEGDIVTMSGEIVASMPVRRTDAAPAAPTITAAATTTPAPVAAAPTPALAPAPAAAPVAAASPVTPAFTYRAAEPVNGKLRGVVELGASGFNSFIVRMDAQRNWKLERADFGYSLVMENLATSDDVRKGLKAYIGQMLEYGVPGNSIYFMVSSGAQKAEVTQKIIRGLKELNYVVNTVTPEQEGQLALRATLPPAYATRGFVLDIGSGNTKISWLQNGTPQSVEATGSKYYESGMDDGKVAAELLAKAAQVPDALRTTCFIIGGVPYELAKPLRKGQERYTVLNAPEAYKQLEKAKTKAGVNIYKAVREATGCQQFVFDWDANFTIGYLLSLK